MPRPGYIEKLLEENNFIPGFYKSRGGDTEADSWSWENRKEEEREQILLDWTTSGSLEAPTIEDPRWSLRWGRASRQQLQGHLGGVL